MTPPPRTKGAATAALLSLALGSFGIGMTEFVVMGLLPEIAQDLLPAVWADDQEGAIASAGMLISLYALGVVIGAPLITGLVARFPRRTVLVLLAVALALTNLLTALLSGFGPVAVSRFLAGLPHGVYFGMAALVAAELLGPRRRAKGVAFVMAGLTIANVVGVPFGTFLGQRWGWHTAFAIVTVVFVLAAVCLAVTVPSRPGRPERTLRAELRVFRLPQVWVALGTGAVGFGGFFAVYSYLAPMVTDVAGGPADLVPVALIVMGVGMTIGNILGGHLADLDLRRTLLGAFGGLAVVLVVFALSAPWLIALLVCVFAVGVVAQIAGPAIQTRLMDVAEDNQSIAAALNHSALNIGNSLGALLGGVVIAIGWGYVSPAWVGAVLAVAGLGIAAWGYLLESRTSAANVS